MIKYADRVYETSTSTGTGAINLDGAVGGFQSFVDGVGNNAKIPYSIFDGDNWETGIGTVLSGSPDQLQRNIVLDSSQGGSAINWGAGTRNVILSASPSLCVWRDENLNDVSSVGVGGGTANAHTVTLAQQPIALSDKMIIRWSAPDTNTGDVTVNVLPLGSKPFVDGAAHQFAAGAIKAGALCQAYYDAANSRFVSLSTATSAAAITYDKTTSGLSATTVQAAVDEVAQNVNDAPKVSFATCDTAGSTAAKVAVLSGFALKKGSTVFVTFANKNTATSGLTLNVNATGAKPIVSESGDAISAINEAYFPSSYKIEFVYDGTNWIYKRRVVKAYRNGTVWYRVYSDGWIEQGGQVAGSWQGVTCAFSIAHMDTNYAAFMVPFWDRVPTGDDGAPIIRQKATGNMLISTASASTGGSCIWQTAGF